MDPQPARRTVARSTEGRWLGGVCAGLAEHLRVPVTNVRLGFILASFLLGLGVLAYAACWLLIPAQGAEPRRWGARPLDLQGVLGLMSLGIGLLMMLALLGLPVRLSVWVPALMAVAGIVVLWRQSDDAGVRPDTRGAVVTRPELGSSRPTHPATTHRSTAPTASAHPTSSSAPSTDLGLPHGDGFHGDPPHTSDPSAPSQPAPAAPVPAHSGPAHSGPAHSGPAHSGPAHSGPAHSGPAHPPDPAAPVPGPLPAASPEPQPAHTGVGRPASAQDRGVIGRVLIGVLLLLFGVLSVVIPRQQLGTFAQAAAALLALLAGLVLIALPWIRAFGRRLQTEQLAAARAEERAAMAARVHDSVLQTLTLIQRRADDPAEVSRLARSEERALRSWLYAPAGPSGMLAATLAEIVAATEADYDLRIELVTVGDVRVDDRVAAMLAATREALVNAAKHAHGSATMVYVEVTESEVEINVRDRGPGFEPDAVDADRHGIRDSIIGRMCAVGGSASVRSAPQEGAEVRLRLPLEVGDE